MGETHQLGSLGSKLHAALASREARSIRRRLPEPTVLGKQSLIDFTSNDYLSLSTNPLLRARFLQKITEPERGQVLGSTGSRLLVNPVAHDRLERRMEAVFTRPGPRKHDDMPQVGLLFNSGFDANVAFYTCIPQSGDVVILDEYIHASVWDGVRASRVEQDCIKTFEHNSIESLCFVIDSLSNTVVERLQTGTSSLFIAVESLYSMDGTLSPLREINSLLSKLFPKNSYLIVDEAHATGIYGPPGRPGCGRVSQLGLDDCRVLARLHTFGKALAGSGAILLTTPLLTSYLINYARPLIYTTALAHPNVILVEAAFDLMVDGETDKLSTHLLALSSYLISLLQTRLNEAGIPPEIISLPPHFLPISTTLPSFDRVRVCLHSGNTREDVEALVSGAVEWARTWAGESKPKDSGRETTRSQQSRTRL
ncbi:pyridoxal phosphate-dependent transferase [Rhodocollybia butyracea]|uniref:Pyridoxal phosphate-dependent transferase n=1 Tax=Rhodocollybia butyracea TaxID=206335 RepID=A0A9P5PVH6_9AGAR|nr:pyridoxal phosphate-dependent transferase [Rhodocollybia butyracea]